MAVGSRAQTCWLQGRERNEKGQGKVRDRTWYSLSLHLGQAISLLVPSSCSLFS